MSRQKLNKASEAPLLAVVIADSFDEKFKPLTREMPRCLIPLHNVPIINYTLEFLAVNRVKEVYMVCKHQAGMIEEYIKKSEWSKYQFMKVKIIVSDTLKNFGDALRELDSLNVIQSDFILVRGDVISNVNLQPILEEHKRRRATVDSKSILTILLRDLSIGHRTKSKDCSSLFIIDATSKRCLQWGDNSPHPKKPFLEINKQRLLSAPEIEIHANVMECGINICSPEVVLCFSDNFDWGRMKSDLVRGLLESELNEWNIYCHNLSDEYAVAITDPHIYDSVSKDVISCWTYPYVLDRNLCSECSFTMVRTGLYMEKDVDLDMTTVIDDRVSIGSHTKINANTIIKDCAIGRNCVIGNNCKIINSHILDNCIVEDNCTISNSIIGKNCIICAGETVFPGTIITSNTTFKLGETDHNSYSCSKNGYANSSRLYRTIDYQLDINTDKNATNSDSESEASETEPFKEDYYAEVQQTLERSINMDHSIADTALELSTLKLGMDISLQDLRTIIFKFFLLKINNECPITTLDNSMKRWGELLTKITQTEDDYYDILDTFEEFVMSNPNKFLPLSAKLLYTLYNNNVMEEGPLHVWHASLIDDDECNNYKLYNEVKSFIDWLKVADEASSDQSE